MPTKNYRHVARYLVVALGLWSAGFYIPARAESANPYAAIAKREYGTAQEELAAIDLEIQAAKADQYPAIEAKLLAVLATPDATMPGKQYVCQALRCVGSDQCIAAVSKLLADEKLTHAARLVLLALNDPAADAALRQALGTTQGNVRVGIINTLGDRKDTAALPALAALLAGNDEPTVRQTLNAIGKIGGTAAADVLEHATVAAALQDAWASAALRCAASLAGADAARADKIYRTLFAGAYPGSVRAGAFAAIVQADKEQAVPTIIKLLGDSDKDLRRAAQAAVVAVPGNAATKALAQAIATLEPAGKAAMLAALAARGDAAGVADLVNTLAADANAVVRLAAIKALARLGDAASVPVLAAALKDSTLAPDATATLSDLQGPGVVEALIQQVPSGETNVRVALLGVLADRHEAAALPTLRTVILDANPAVRRAAFKTLGSLGVAEDFSPLLALLLEEKNKADADPISDAMGAICRRQTDKSALCQTVLAALPTASESCKIHLFGVLAITGDDKALQGLRTALTGSADLRKAAIRAMGNWTNAAPMADLLQAAKDDTDKDAANHILALRGYINMAGLLTGPAAKKLPAYQEAMTLATRTDEKRLVLAGLADVADVGALQMVEPFLAEKSLKTEALLAYESIAEAIAGRKPAVAKEALQRVIKESSDRKLRDKATKALGKIKK